MIGSILLMASSLAGTQQIQRQLDFIVGVCRAEEVVRLIAHEGNAVSVRMMKPGRLPTVSENKAFQCALAKVKERPDLHLGFTEEEAAPEVQKR